MNSRTRARRWQARAARTLVGVVALAASAGCSHDGRTLKPPVYPAPPPPTTLAPTTVPDASDLLGVG